jgi:hypothetical protein
MTAARGIAPVAAQMLSAASWRPVSPAVLTVKMSLPFSFRVAAA